MGDVTTDRMIQREADQKLCQQIAETFWQAATSDNTAIASYDSATYRGLERAFIASVRVAYGLSQAKARLVRNVFAEWGPQDVGAVVEYVLTDEGAKDFAD